MPRPVNRLPRPPGYPASRTRVLLISAALALLLIALLVGSFALELPHATDGDRRGLFKVTRDGFGRVLRSEGVVLSTTEMVVLVLLLLLAIRRSRVYHIAQRVGAVLVHDGELVTSPSDTLPDTSSQASRVARDRHA